MSAIQTTVRSGRASSDLGATSGMEEPVYPSSHLRRWKLVDPFSRRSKGSASPSQPAPYSPALTATVELGPLTEGKRALSQVVLTHYRNPIITTFSDWLFPFPVLR